MKKATKKLFTVIMAMVLAIVMTIPAFAYTPVDDDGNREKRDETSMHKVYSTIGMLRIMDEGTTVTVNEDKTVTVRAQSSTSTSWGGLTKLALIEQTATAEEKDAAAADVVFENAEYTDQAVSRIFTFTIPLQDVGKKIPVCRYVSTSATEGAWKDFTNQEYLIVEYEALPPLDLEPVKDDGVMMTINAAQLYRKDGAPWLKLTIKGTSFDRVFCGYASEANRDDTGFIPIEHDTEADASYVDIPMIGGFEEEMVYAFHGSKYYNRSLWVNREGKQLIYGNTVLSLEQFDNMTTEEAVARAESDTSVETVDMLIEAIQSQVWTENTDKYCIIAKAYYDALSDRDKAKLQDPGYFGDDTGDASADKAKEEERQATPIGEKELLVVSFGTSFNDSRTKTILAVENALEDAYPEYSVRRAFTAQIIINHIAAREGYTIDNMQQALDRAVKSGVKELIIQPTHLMHGYEYDEMCEALKPYENQISIAVSEPLLNSVADKNIVAQAVVDATIADPTCPYRTIQEADEAKTAVVYMGHGTSHPANQTYNEMQEIFGELGYKNVFVGTVEGEPEETEVNTVLAKVQAAGYTSVILRPLMVVAGDHANNDMADPEDPESWFSIFSAALGAENVTCQINGLGEIPTVQQLYIVHTHDCTKHADEPGFTLCVDGKEITAIEKIEDGYNASHMDWMTMTWIEEFVPLYVVSVPEGTENVEIALNDSIREYQDYYYQRDFEPSPESWDDGYRDYGFGDDASARYGYEAYVALADKVYTTKVVKDQVIRVQTAYLDNKSITLYAIAFDDVVPVTKVALNKTKASLAVGKKLTLKATVTPKDATDKTVTWTSSDKKIATVDKNGKVTAKKAGKVKITATANDGSGKKATCTITVTQPVTKVTLNKTKATLKVKKTLQLKATITPKNATNKKVKWTTSNKKIATVDKNGKVTAKKAGKVTITCTAQDGSKKKATCKITVKK